MEREPDKMIQIIAKSIYLQSTITRKLYYGKQIRGNNNY